MFPFDLGSQGQKDYDQYMEFLNKFFYNLKKENNLNPNIENIREETSKRISYFDELRKATDKLDWILFAENSKVYEKFLEVIKPFGVTRIHFMQIYGSLLLFNMLVFYSNIETLFLTMLKGSRYGIKKDDLVKGDETLSPLLRKIFLLDKKTALPEETIRRTLDTKLRNSLAHGWYRIEKHQLVYFEESLESEPKTMDEIEMIARIIHLRNFGIALTHTVLAGNWKQN